MLSRHTLYRKLQGQVVRREASCQVARRAGCLPDEGVILGAKGPTAVTTDLVIDKFMDPEESASKDLAVDRISGSDVQFDGGVRDTINEYLGCCERVVRSRISVSREVAGQGG